MSFKVLHRGYQHIRLSSSFSLTLDIQDYLRSLARDEKGIESIQFYMDQQRLSVYFFVVLCRILFAIYGLVIRLLAILEKPIKH